MLEHGLLNHENDILANENTNKEMIKKQYSGLEKILKQHCKITQE